MFGSENEMPFEYLSKGTFQRYFLKTTFLGYIYLCFNRATWNLLELFLTRGVL